jgi:hypothetical protein
MAEKETFEYSGYGCNYKGLLINELIAISAYMDQYDNSKIIEIIKDSQYISHGMRSFIAEIFFHATEKRQR